MLGEPAPRSRYSEIFLSQVEDDLGYLDEDV